MNVGALFNPPRGMRDFYPQDMNLRNLIFDAWQRSARASGFEPYDACVVESLELLTRKAGEEISDQLYTFTDKSGRALALRAEMTPTLARMIVARQNELQFPLKWYSIAQCFRYERMSKGRKREHYQWNLDIVGESSLLAEAEVIGAAAKAIFAMGLAPRDIKIHINNRALMADIFLKLGIEAAHHAAVFLALDKRGKIDDDAVRALLQEAGLAPDAIGAAFRVLAITTLDEAETAMGGPTASSAAVRDLLAFLGQYGLAEAAIFDIGVIRGLGYYTGIVFECFDTGKSMRAIFGGGRYDNLLQSIGGKPMTAVGLGFGDVVIADLLQERGLHAAAMHRTDCAVGFMEEAQRACAISIAQAIRGARYTVDLGLHHEKPKHFFARAGGGGCRAAIYIGPDDVARGSVRVKNLDQRVENEAVIADLTAGTAPLARIFHTP